MKKIAICDDNIDVVKKIHVNIEKIIEEMNLEEQFTIEEFVTGFSFEDALEQGEVFDIVFMDIVLGRENGIDVSFEMKKLYGYTKVVFITGYTEYVEDIFKIEPFALLIKPIDYEKLKLILEKWISSLKTKEDEYIFLNLKEGIKKIKMNQIQYVESIGRYLIFQCEDNIPYKCIMTMSDAEKLLSKSFVRCHRSFFINFDKVDFVGNMVVSFNNGRNIPISRNKYKEIKAMFENKYFDNGVV